MKRDSRKPLTKEEIKAIRIVMGFNRDLRKKLIGVRTEYIYEFIRNNREGIFGPEYRIFPDIIKEQEAWVNLRNIIKAAARQVINGH